MRNYLYSVSSHENHRGGFYIRPLKIKYFRQFLCRGWVTVPNCEAIFDVRKCHENNKTRPVFKGNIPMKSGLFVYCINFLKRRDGKPVPCNIYIYIRFHNKIVHLTVGYRIRLTEIRFSTQIYDKK